MHPKTVLIATDFAHVNGGQAKVAIDSARLLAEAGIEVIFLAAVAPVDAALHHPNIRLELLDQADILSDGNRLAAAARGIWNRRAARRLRALAAQCDPASTVLHCHGFIKALSASVGPVLTDGPLASVFTMHEYFLACPNGAFYDFQRNEICTRRALGADCLTTNCDARKAVHKAWRVARQAVIRGAGHLPSGLREVIYISETQRRAMAPYLAPHTRLHHVPNPVAIAAQEAAPADLAERDIFLFVGRLAPEKGGLLFAEAARRAGVRAVFVGDGPEAAMLRARYPEVDHTGWLAPDQVGAQIARARALVFPSLWYEGQPLVPIEALGRGVPVVTGAWSAAAEIVRDGVNGVICTRPDVAAFAEALGRVRALPAFDPAPYRQMNAPEKHLERLLEVYSRSLERHVGGGGAQ